MEIKVVGPGCKSCKSLLNLTKAAVRELVPDTEVVYVTDMSEIMATGIMRMPGLVINGKIKVTGRVPSLSEIIKMIKDEMNPAR
jgi:small redox-active disulfide protein 2